MALLDSPSSCRLAWPSNSLCPYAFLSSSSRRQAEFDQQLLEGEKTQMMNKLDMLLMTRGEPMEVTQLVRTQTELEVEVRKLKVTVERAEAQTAEAMREVRTTNLVSKPVDKPVDKPTNQQLDADPH
jgi:hypothetical protein